MKKIVEPLGYSYDALEPFIDEQTMRVHHDKHHQAYIDKLNAAIEKYSDLKEKSSDWLILNLDKVPNEIRTAVRNNAGGDVAHSFFWRLLKKDVKISGEILSKINSDFGSYEKFKEQFSMAANNFFGSGWVWLVLDNEKLKIVSTQGHDNPMTEGKKPILVIDVWEHAYYLKYQNRRAEYVSAFFNVINWEEVNNNLRK